MKNVTENTAAALPIREQLVTTGYAPPCPPWCTDKLGCEEWQQYNDHQWRAHEMPLASMELTPRYPEGPGRLRIRLGIFADEGYRVNWDARTVEHCQPVPGISVHVSERAPDAAWSEAELRLTSAAAFELASNLQSAAEHLLRIERGMDTVRQHDEDTTMVPSPLAGPPLHQDESEPELCRRHIPGFNWHCVCLMEEGHGGLCNQGGIGADEQTCAAARVAS